MVDDEALSEAGIDGIEACQRDGSLAGRSHVLVVHRVVPAVMTVVGEVVAAARRLCIPKVEGWIDAGTFVADRSVEFTNFAIGRVVRDAVVEDRRDVVPGRIGSREKGARDGSRRRGRGGKRQSG